MARLIQLDTDVYVAPQLVAEDFDEIAARGFRAVVDNRPDGEVPEQLPAAAAERETVARGMAFAYQPVPNLDVTDDDVVAAFAGLLDSLPRPVLFYCRSGTRCTLLWAQASAARLGSDAVIAMAAKAGYDITAIADILEQRAAMQARPAPATG
jgi:sulfide:quinone oxidoreductase